MGVPTAVRLDLEGFIQKEIRARLLEEPDVDEVPARALRAGGRISEPIVRAIETATDRFPDADGRPDRRYPGFMVEIREAVEADVVAIRRLFEAAYGDDYTYPEFYEDDYLKKLVLGDDTLVLVAADEETGRVVGTASVVLEVGAYTDLVGEFGRLVVAPEARGRGIGSRLMEERVLRVADRLHVGMLEARVIEPWSVRIAHKHGFATVGFVPMKNRFGDRQESFALMVRHFGESLRLRRNHPRIVPEAYQLAGLAMESCGLDADVVVDEEALP